MTDTGTEEGEFIATADNVVHVRPGGHLDIGLRSWADSRRRVMSGNVVTVDPGGSCTRAVDVRGDGALVTANCLHDPDDGEPILLSIRGGSTVVTGNLLENVTVDVSDETDKGLPILVHSNIMHDLTIAYTAGELITAPQ